MHRSLPTGVGYGQVCGYLYSRLGNGHISRTGLVLTFIITAGEEEENVGKYKSKQRKQGR